MKRILVPTDFSQNSEKGLEFAFEWAKKDDLTIVVLHVLHTWQKLSMTNEEFVAHEAAEKEEAEQKISSMVNNVKSQVNPSFSNYETVVISGVIADAVILEYCNNSSDFDFICISTKGANNTEKILGTNTSNLISRSPVPVLAVPSGYNINAIEKVIYASDMENFDHELDDVKTIVLPLNAHLEVIHFIRPSEYEEVSALANARTAEFAEGKYTVSFMENDGSQPLVELIHKRIQSNPPDLLIMFTNQNKKFFDRIFFGSKSAEVSYTTEVPLLVFAK